MSARVALRPLTYVQSSASTRRTLARKRWKDYKKRKSQEPR